MRLAIATDAWHPQVNGVVRTLDATISELSRQDWEVSLVTPADFLTLPLPGYASIRLAVAPWRKTRALLEKASPQVVHIATEGPIGWSARRWCLRNGVPFTTAFHTMFPDYLSVRTGISAERFWPFMRHFHQPGRAIMVATPSLRSELASRGLGHTVEWTRGIDRSLFEPYGPTHPVLDNLPRPLLLNVGRVSHEKNLQAFLDLPFAGSKVVIGDGPALAELRRKYPAVHFTGTLAGKELASAYRSADCFVFPSLTDTFGLVIIEALACGVPVAAFPVTGPLDIVGLDGRGPGSGLERPVGALDRTLGAAIEAALKVNRADAADFGARYSWANATQQFIEAIQVASQPCFSQQACRQAEDFDNAGSGLHPA